MEASRPVQYPAVQPRPREGPPPPKPLNVRLDEEPHAGLEYLEQRLTTLARQHYRSLNGEMLAALRAWVEAGDGASLSRGAGPVGR